MDRREVRKKRRQDQVREEILDASRRVILAGGLSGLTLSAVARELQLTKAALYYYFPSKEALVFELIYLGLDNHSAAVECAIKETSSGAGAIEALIRAAADHYGDRKDELRLAYLVPQVGSAGATQIDAEMLAKIRPFNDRIYGAVAEKIRQDQDAGRIADEIDGRQLAFLAHTSVLGMLTVEGLAEAANDAPLLHSRQPMVDELVSTFRARLAPSD